MNGVRWDENMMTDNSSLISLLMQMDFHGQVC